MFMSCITRPLGDDVGRVGEGLHHAHVVGFDHHLECAGVIGNRPTSTLAGLPKVSLVARRPRRRVEASTTSSCSRVAVNELDHRGEVETPSPAVAECRRSAAAEPVAGACRRRR